jgi:hypothetical protein
MSSPTPRKKRPQSSLTNSPDFWEREAAHASLRQRNEAQSIRNRQEIDSPPAPKQKFYRPPPFKSSPDSSSSPPRRRREPKQEAEERKKAAEAKEIEDSVLYRWYHPESHLHKSEPIIGPPPKVKPTFSSPSSPPKPPKEPPVIVFSGGQKFEDFLERQAKMTIQKVPSSPPTFFMEKSRQILASPSKISRVNRSPSEGCAFQPNRHKEVIGLPLEFVEPHVLLRNVRHAALELERTAIESVDIGKRPKRRDIEKRNRLAANSAIRSHERALQGNEHNEEEDFHEIVEKTRKKRLRRNENWKKKMHIVEYDRASRSIKPLKKENKESEPKTLKDDVSQTDVQKS